jgi:hypothetical protein
MSHARNIAGQRFGRLVATTRTATSFPERCPLWECVCDCGKTALVRSNSLRPGKTRSCGCLRIEKLVARVKKHGLSESKIYNVWACAKRRCESPKCKSYPDYGGRGIRMLLTFDEFVAELGEKPTPEHSVDRIDNDKGYEKGNLRWATRKEQNNNRRAYGKKRGYTVWCEGIETQHRIEDYVPSGSVWLAPQKVKRTRPQFPTKRKVVPECPGCDRAREWCECYDDWEIPAPDGLPLAPPTKFHAPIDERDLYGASSLKI